jgi:hypothetical protein
MRSCSVIKRESSLLGAGGGTGRALRIFLPMQNKKSFTELLPACRAELQNHVQYLHSKNSGWRLGIDSGDLFHDVVVKLSSINPLVVSRNALFDLVGKVALNRLRDLGRRHAVRQKFLSVPMPTRSRPVPGGSIESVASKGHSPAELAELKDQVAVIRASVEDDPHLARLFQKFAELVDMGEATSTENLSRHLHVPSKQVLGSIKHLRSVARRVV